MSGTPGHDYRRTLVEACRWGAVFLIIAIAALIAGPLGALEILTTGFLLITAAILSIMLAEAYGIAVGR